MHLTPSARDHLQLFMVAELARRRLQRGVLLNVPEATALVADAVVEVARDGRRHAEALLAGQQVLTRAELLPGVAEVVGDVCVEATFEDGTRLVIVPDPFGPPAPPAMTPNPDSVEAGKMPPGSVVRRGDGPGSSQGALLQRPGQVRLRVVNTGSVPVTVTSHYHFFEVNRVLSFDRVTAYGRRLALPGGSTVRFDPGEPRDVELVAIGGGRVVVGFSGYVDGWLDDPAVRDAAFRRARDAGLIATADAPPTDARDERRSCGTE